LWPASSKATSATTSFSVTATEIQPDDLRALCNKVKERGAPATAVQIRDIVKQVYAYANAQGKRRRTPPTA